jgi:mannose-6-phosphate isomerase-like protein (cupin superfamily)
MKAGLRKVTLKAELERIDAYWSPQVIASVNDLHVKLVKLQGEFVWHHHENEDELFLVLQGVLRLRLRDREVELQPGELFVVPRGVEHLPVADEEVHVLLLEPASTRRRGNLEEVDE